MSLTAHELRLAADAAERWPSDVSCANRADFDIACRIDKSNLPRFYEQCGCPAMVVEASRDGFEWNHDVFNELKEVFGGDFAEAIDAGRGSEVAAAFRKRADELEQNQ